MQGFLFHFPQLQEIPVDAPVKSPYNNSIVIKKEKRSSLMEENRTKQPFLLESAGIWLLSKIRENKVPLLASFLIGLLAHMFAFSNKLVNHDDVFTLFFKGGTLSLGRWGLGLLDTIFPNYSMPWIYGILTIALMTAAICLIIHIFRIKSKVLQVLLAGAIITFPSLTGTFTYMFTVSSYAVSFLLAVAAVWMLNRDLKKNFVPAVIVMILSLSIYQSYVAVAASLLVLIIIREVLYEEDVLPLIQKGCLFVVFLIASLGIYYAATMVINRFFGPGFNSYAGGNLSFSFATIPMDIVDAYTTFFRYLTDGFRGLIPNDFCRVVHALCFAAAGLLLVLWALAQKRKRLPRIALLLSMLAVLPLAINCMHLFTTADAVHTLVLYSFVAIYVLFAFLADACLELVPAGKWLRSIALNVVTFGLAALIAANTYIANEAYLCLYLRYENAYAFYTTLVADLKMHPEFDEDTKLAVIGTFDEPDFYLDKFYFSDHITGTDGFLPDIYSKDRFLEYYLGFPMEFASDEEIAQITASSQYEAMAVYPYYGCMEMIGDTFVVKLS